MITEKDLDSLPGLTLTGQDDAELGTIDSVYRDVDNAEPLFAAVSTKAGPALVPLVQAELAEGTVTVPYSAAQVVTAPSFEDHDDLTPEDEQSVFEHYGLPTSVS